MINLSENNEQLMKDDIVTKAVMKDDIVTKAVTIVSDYIKNRGNYWLTWWLDVSNRWKKAQKKIKPM